MTLFAMEEVLPSGGKVEALSAASLQAQVTETVEALSAAVGEDSAALWTRALKLLNLSQLRAADDHDLREVLRELQLCLQEGRGAYRKRLQRITRVPRPEGIGRLPRPRTMKLATADGTCGLCGDSIGVGEPIGRMPAPEFPYEAMGWLCWHCLVERRQQPRRRDVLLRVFHQLFADDGIGLNAYECAVLKAWLTEDPALAQSKPWLSDPLENTLVRLQTSVDEGKPTTWLSAQTAHTIVAVLQEAPASPATTPQDSEMLRALAEHLAEWEMNPPGVQRRKYGTGWRYRQQVLTLTAHPTVLSERGGPFFLYQCRTTSTGALVEPAS